MLQIRLVASGADPSPKGPVPFVTAGGHQKSAGRGATPVLATPQPPTLRCGAEARWAPPDKPNVGDVSPERLCHPLCAAGGGGALAGVPRTGAWSLSGSSAPTGLRRTSPPPWSLSSVRGGSAEPRCKEGTWGLAALLPPGARPCPASPSLPPPTPGRTALGEEGGPRGGVDTGARLGPRCPVARG